LYIFGDKHGLDIESRQLPKITAQGENHGNHGDREFVIYIHPYLLINPRTTTRLFNLRILLCMQLLTYETMFEYIVSLV